LFGVCLLLVGATTVFHYEALKVIGGVAARRLVSPRQAALTLMLFLPLVHFMEMLAYALVFFLVRDEFRTGTLVGAFSDSFITYVYFSMETYTSLGFGDILPQGASRLLVGIEALNGLLLLGWSASYILIMMQRKEPFEK
jgi:hypothetical protein